MTWRGWIEATAVGALPVAASLALYLPSGAASPVRLLTLGVCCLAAARAWRDPGVLLTRNAVVTQAVLAVFVMLAVVGRLRYPALTSSVHLLHLALIVAACWSLMVLGRQRRALRALLWGWLVAGAMSAAVGLWETVSGHHLSRHAAAAYYRTRSPNWNQIAAFFDNPNLYAYHLVVVGQVLVMMSAGSTWRSRLALLAGLALVVQQLLMTDGRLALAVLALSLALISLRTRAGRVLVPVGALAAGVAHAWGWELSHRLIDPFWLQWHGVYGGRSAWVRVGMLRGAWHMSAESGGLGVGPGGFDARVNLPTNPFRVRNFSNAHFGMSEVLADYGVVGLVVLLVALGVGAAACLRALRRFSREGLPRWGFDRTTAAMGAAMLVTLPPLTLAHSTWLRQPLTAAHLATLTGVIAYVCATTQLARATELAE